MSNIWKKDGSVNWKKVRYNPNLAGVKNCDEQIRKELREAGIKVIQQDYNSSNEVPFSNFGKLGQFTFVRAWYYWCVYGNVPLNVANEIYNNPLGYRDVRTCGYAGNIDPNEMKYDVYVHDDYSSFEKIYVIDSYHIDSQDGLNYFTETLRKHNLILSDDHPKTKKNKHEVQVRIDISPNKYINKFFHLSELDLECSGTVYLSKVESIIKRIYKEDLEEAESFEYSINGFVKMPPKVKPKRKAVQIANGVTMFVDND